MDGPFKNVPYNVYLTGGDGYGWALDQDLATTRFALNQMLDLINFMPLKGSDVIHSVWEEPLLEMDLGLLNGKRIVCHICNDVLRTFENAYMLHAVPTIGMWICISKKACSELEALGFRNMYIPYTINTNVFTRSLNEDKRALRKKYNVPANRYVIANFMRDSLGHSLDTPKRQKSPELFLEIVTCLYREGSPIHVLLAGPRRHWLRTQLQERRIPFTYIGKIIEGDDLTVNLLSQEEIRSLYALCDLMLITSRWEGGPRAVLEAAATGTPCLSRPVGLAPDVLEPGSLVKHVDEAVDAIVKDVRKGVLKRNVEVQYRRVMKEFSPEANIPRFRKLYENLNEVPSFDASKGFYQTENEPRAPRFKRISQISKRLFKRGRTGRRLTFGFWHQFFSPPYGGGNQFMMALKKAIERQGAAVIVNQASSKIDVYLCNSVWFNVQKFEKVAKSSIRRLIHRVDGPIAIYRGSNWEHDEKIYEINSAFASATVYQSGWCFKRMLELGFKPVNPLVIRNAVDPAIFHRQGRIQFSKKRKIRLIATAWSDNLRKGGPFLKSFEKKLDTTRYEFTFVGNTKEEFEKIRHIPPQTSEKLAETLRQHDIYIMASQSEACSNALIEALACGLPTLYLEDGGNGELVQFGGLPFTNEKEAAHNLERLVNEYGAFQACIDVESIDEIAKRYIDLAHRILDHP